MVVGVVVVGVVDVVVVVEDVDVVVNWTVVD